MALGLRGRAGIAAIVFLGLAWGLTMHAMGWAQTAFYAQTRALADGGTEIDRWHWETQDKAWIDRHYYSVKAPGLSAVTSPAYLGLDAIGARRWARDAARNARRTDHPRWTFAASTAPPFGEFGHRVDRARRVWDRIEVGAPMVWALTLVGAVIPAVLLLLGVRWVADRIEPGYGTAAAVPYPGSIRSASQRTPSSNRIAGITAPTRVSAQTIGASTSIRSHTRRARSTLNPNSPNGGAVPASNVHRGWSVRWALRAASRAHRRAPTASSPRYAGTVIADRPGALTE